MARLPVLVVLAALLMAAGWARAQVSSGALRSTVQTPVGSGVLTVWPPSPLTTQTVELTVQLTLDAGWELSPVVVGKEQLPEGWSVIGGESGTPEVRPDGSRVMVRSVRLEPFLPGEVEIGPVELRLVRGEESHTVRTAPVRVTVRSVLPEDEADPEPAGIRSIVGLPFAMPAWAWGVVGGVVAMAAAVAALVVMMARRARRIRLVRLTAHETALKRLEAVLSRDLLATGRFKEFYNEVSLILRRYIEDRFGLAAPERTTEEFLREGRSSGVLAEADVAMLEEFLSHCDLVKFAGARPDPARLDQTESLVRGFIERTRSAEAQLVVDPSTGEARRPERLSDPVIAAAAKAGRTSVEAPARAGGGG